ncbi:MAG: MoaD/ThiS family protein [Actinobacteria bacterium]|nr:MoaD/ThiS family protein [Actinomycetota bacterium]
MKVRFMPPLNKLIGENSIVLNCEGITLGELITMLNDAYPSADNWLADPHYPLLIAVNNKLFPVSQESYKTCLSVDSEVVFMLPLSGG